MSPKVSKPSITYNSRVYFCLSTTVTIALNSLDNVQIIIDPIKQFNIALASHKPLNNQDRLTYKFLSIKQQH